MHTSGHVMQALASLVSQLYDVNVAVVVVNGRTLAEHIPHARLTHKSHSSPINLRCSIMLFHIIGTIIIEAVSKK